MDTRFMGYDEELKDFRVYWLAKHLVSIERDVYLNKDEVLLPDSIRLEGENCNNFNPDISLEPNIPSGDSHAKTEAIDVNLTPMESDDQDDSNAPKNAENDSKLTKTQANQSLTPENLSKISFFHEQSMPSPTLRHGMRSRKADGFYNEKNLEKIGEGVHMVDTEGILEPGRVELEDTESERIDWLGIMMEYAFAAQEGDSPSLEEAMRGPEKKKWMKAVYEEYQNLSEFGTFTIVPTPAGITPINGKNVLHKKHDGEGKLACYKARYIIRGFKQKFGID